MFDAVSAQIPRLPPNVILVFGELIKLITVRFTGSQPPEMKSTRMMMMCKTSAKAFQNSQFLAVLINSQTEKTVRLESESSQNNRPPSVPILICTSGIVKTHSQAGLATK